MRQKINKYFQGDNVIWAAIAVLFLFSLLAVYSSTGTLAYEYRGGNTLYYFFRHFGFMLFGVAVVYIVHKIPYRYYAWLSQILVYIAIILLIFTLLLGVTRNEATRWLSLPGTGIEFQTSDFAKFALIVYVARVLSQVQKSEEARKTALRPLLLAIIGVCGLILPDNFSTAVTLFGTVWVLMYIGRIEMKYLWSTIGILVAAVALFIAFAWAMDSDTRINTWKNRIESYVTDKEGDSFQADQAKIAIATGGILGKGPGNSTQRNFLPQPYSDFIFAIVVEEYGFAGAFILVMIYLILLYRTGLIVKKCSRTFPAFLVIGLALIIVFQAFINMAVAVHILPVTGQTLPLVSMGGTSILFSSIALGIILSVSRTLEKESGNKNRQVA